MSSSSESTSQPSIKRRKTTGADADEEEAAPDAKMEGVEGASMAAVGPAVLEEQPPYRVKSLWDTYMTASEASKGPLTGRRDAGQGDEEAAEAAAAVSHRLLTLLKQDGRTVRIREKMWVIPRWIEDTDSFSSSSFEHLEFSYPGDPYCPCEEWSRMRSCRESRLLEAGRDYFNSLPFDPTDVDPDIRMLLYVNPSHHSVDYLSTPCPCTTPAASLSSPCLVRATASVRKPSGVKDIPSERVIVKLDQGRWSCSDWRCDGRVELCSHLRVMRAHLASLHTLSLNIDDSPDNAPLSNRPPILPSLSYLPRPPPRFLQIPSDPPRIDAQVEPDTIPNRIPLDATARCRECKQPPSPDSTSSIEHVSAIVYSLHRAVSVPLETRLCDKCTKPTAWVCSDPLSYDLFAWSPTILFTHSVLNAYLSISYLSETPFSAFVHVQTASYVDHRGVLRFCSSEIFMPAYFAYTRLVAIGTGRECPRPGEYPKKAVRNKVLAGFSNQHQTGLPVLGLVKEGKHFLGEEGAASFVRFYYEVWNRRMIQGPGR